jgi:hypothetical protein
MVSEKLMEQATTAGVQDSRKAEESRSLALLRCEPGPITLEVVGTGLLF